ncbi:MAG: hypothetical protein ACO1RX_10360 [Candidatus Sericytochromatia bacterium]
MQTPPSSSHPTPAAIPAATRQAAASPAPAANAPAPAPAPKPAGDQRQIQTQAGKALTQVSLASAPQAPDFQLLGLKQGDTLEVDGTLTADGSATVKTLRADTFELQARINIPGVARGLASKEFQLENGKVNLSIKLSRQGDKYRYELIDNASGKNKGSGTSALKIENGSKTVSSLFGSGEKVATQTVTVKTDQGDLSIRLQQNKKGEVSGSVTIPGLPSIISTFDLEKN